MKHSRICLLVLLLFGTGQTRAQPKDEAAKLKLASQAQQILETSCARCHDDQPSSGEAFNVRDLVSLLAKHGDETPVVIPGKATESKLYDAMVKGRMPKKNTPEKDGFTKEQAEIIKQWIDAGAPAFTQEAPRNFVSLKTVLKSIKDDLDAANLEDRPNLRYFTLTNVHNNSTKPMKQLHLLRAALSKSINSLTWSEKIHSLRAVNPKETAYTVYAVDITKLGWKRSQWEAIVSQYPYGLSYNNTDDADLKKYDNDIERLVNRQTKLSYVRADWFVSTATRGNLYHSLLFDDYLPALVKRETDSKNPANPKNMTARDLELFLNVLIEKNLLENDIKAIRAGFPKSGVSGNNRMIERHSIDGRRYYWKSYDFKGTTWEANLQQFPFGPNFNSKELKALYGDLAKRFPNTILEDKAFIHDGGEIIFSLPNGMQGFLLVDGNDRRIDAGPIEVVSDALRTSGTALIVNGMSCMACHKDGMIKSPKDTVRDGAAVFGEQRDRLKKLYPTQEEIEKAIQRDSDYFQLALAEAVLPMLKEAGMEIKDIKELTEPVGEVVREYLLKDLDLATVAAELYVQELNTVKNKISNNVDIVRLGLGALVNKHGAIKRGAWESVRGSSQMQMFAREFGFTPRN